MILSRSPDFASSCPLPLSLWETGLGGEVCASYGVVFWRTGSCPPHSNANRSTKARPDRRTTRAERAVPSSNADWCAAEGVRPEGYVHPVRVFALCIWQAPRPVATFGSFWSLQKEPAGGREFGETWNSNLNFSFGFNLTAVSRRPLDWGAVVSRLPALYLFVFVSWRVRVS